jgi:adhesin/invasin
MGLALADVPVAWATPDGGKVTGFGTRTDSLGEARAQWVLGPKAGRQRVRAQVGNVRFVPPFTGHATAKSGAAASVAIKSGDKQNGAVAKALVQPIVVRALDRNGNAVPGASIKVSAADGRAADTLVTADSAGLARIKWTLGQAAGAQRLAVKVAGRDAAIEVTARARAGEPTSMRFIAASMPTTAKSTGKPVVVEVGDAYGNPVADRSVSFSATGGTLSSARMVTNSSGRASVMWKIPGKSAKASKAKSSLTARLAGTDVKATLPAP